MPAERYRYIHPDGTEVVREVPELKQVVNDLKDVARGKAARAGKVNAVVAMRINRDLRSAVTRRDEELGRVLAVSCHLDEAGLVFQPVTYMGVEVVLERKQGDEWVEVFRRVAEDPIDV